jgi:hypothetical protein
MWEMSVKLDNVNLQKKLSMEALDDADTGYYIDTNSDTCYVKIPYNGNAATITLSGDKNVFESVYAAGTITTKVDTDAEKAYKFNVITAVYSEKGVLVKVLTSGTFNASCDGVTVDVSDYPLEKYMIKVFCWRDDMVPLFKEKQFK